MNHTTNPQAARAELSAKLWQIAEHHIVAEWICCEPVDPKHELCAKGHAALGMVRTLLVDSPEAWNPAAPLLDAVLGMLPAASPSVVVSADRATLLREAADHLDALPLSGVEGGIRSALTDELRRVAAEQPAETQTVDRAAVLHDAAIVYAEILGNVPDHSADPRYWQAIRDVIVGLRRMAAEQTAARPVVGEQPDTQEAP